MCFCLLTPALWAALARKLQLGRLLPLLRPQVRDDIRSARSSSG
jgi:hypothetical protein